MILGGDTVEGQRRDTRSRAHELGQGRRSWADGQVDRPTPETPATHHQIHEHEREVAGRRTGADGAEPITRPASHLARKVLTLAYYGLRDGEIRCLTQADAA